MGHNARQSDNNINFMINIANSTSCRPIQSVIIPRFCNITPMTADGVGLHSVLLPIIHMKKLLNSDWLRAVQFKCNTSAKSVTPVQRV